MGATKRARREIARVRLSAAELHAFQETAKLAGIGMSTWMRERLRHVATRELEEAGRIPAFLRERVR